MSRMPLEGIRIVDFCWVWAGPTCTSLLAMLGAEVIKIETWDKLDPSRRAVMKQGSEPTPPNQSLHFNMLNPNKHDITLNLFKPKAIELVKELVNISDAVANNFSGEVMEKELGLHYENLVKIRPDIILLSMPGFGSSGPWCGYRGYDSTFGALSGLTGLSGYAEGLPSGTRAGAHIDIVNGMTAAFALMLALNHRAETGEGQFVDLAHWEVCNCLMGESFLDFAMNKRNPSRRENRDALMAPHNCYPCQGEDKWVSIAIGSEDEWKSFCQATGHEAWLGDARFAGAAARRQNQEELDAAVAEWTKQFTHLEVAERLQRAGVAAMPAFNHAELLADPHLKERACWIEVEHPEMGRHLQLSPPWKLSGTPAKITSYAPLVGEHNEHVFCELLGMPVEEFATLIGDQVIT